MKIQSNILYLSHGGGPLPLLGDSNHKEMVRTLTHIAKTIDTPKAILVISAHWESEVATITSGPRPSLIYDYSGFSKESYEIQYPCPGDPELANEVYQSLSSAGIQTRLDSNRGFDHGLFVPLKIMYPQADIPCVQLSLVHSLDPKLHIKIGKALQALKQQRLLVIGSGFSFHNMRAFFYPNEKEAHAINHEFENWLQSTMMDSDLSEENRSHLLKHWSQAPQARFCHPREEHLLPLHVCYGMACRAADIRFDTKIMGVQSSMYPWEN